MIRRAFRRWAIDPEAPAVAARNLSKVYRGGDAGESVDALRGIDLRIERGELIAIIGPSGCGKTTLLNCLAALESDYAGEVILAGVPLARLSDDARARLRAATTGFIFQSFNLLPTLSAVENVEMPLLIAGVAGREARQRALSMLGDVGLSDRAQHRPAGLSGGQQQRVAIARALVNRPAIVWADEPTGNLDSDSTSEIMGLIQRLNAQNDQTFVIVTHDASVAAVASRLIQMRDGQIVSDVPSLGIASSRAEQVP
jgi:putative ABC transport system ATP-binding protein